MFSCFWLLISCLCFVNSQVQEFQRSNGSSRTNFPTQGLSLHAVVITSPSRACMGVLVCQIVFCYSNLFLGRSSKKPLLGPIGPICRVPSQPAASEDPSTVALFFGLRPPGPVGPPSHILRRLKPPQTPPYSIIGSRSLPRLGSGIQIWNPAE